MAGTRIRKSMATTAPGATILIRLIVGAGNLSLDAVITRKDSSGSHANPTE